MNVVSIREISGRFRAASMNFCVLLCEESEYP